MKSILFERLLLKKEEGKIVVEGGRSDEYSLHKQPEIV